MPSEWRRRLDERKRRRRKRERQMYLFAYHFRRLRESGKLTNKALDEIALKYLGVDHNR